MLKEDLEREFAKLKKEHNISLKDFIAPYVYKKYKDPKLVLISIILSQNSTDKAALTAFERLYESLKKGKRDINSIENSIRVAGLAKQKAKYIENVLNLPESYFKEIIEEDVEESRRKLMQNKGIGEKTADVFLSIYGKKVFPVDRHIMRIGKRLGIGNNYRQISEYFLKTLGNDIKYHIMLISHGRYICKAKEPLCEICYLRKYCRYYRNKKATIN